MYVSPNPTSLHATQDTSKLFNFLHPGIDFFPYINFFCEWKWFLDDPQFITHLKETVALGFFFYLFTLQSKEPNWPTSHVCSIVPRRVGFRHSNKEKIRKNPVLSLRTLTKMVEKRRHIRISSWEPEMHRDNCSPQITQEHMAEFGNEFSIPEDQSNSLI